jgi:hypothetical protein
MVNGKLDEKVIVRLLREADNRWYKTHSGQYKYQEHIEFEAAYIAKNYYRKDRR